MLQYYRDYITDLRKRRNFIPLEKRESVPEIVKMDKCISDEKKELHDSDFHINLGHHSLSPIQMFFLQWLPIQLDVGKVR